MDVQPSEKGERLLQLVSLLCELDNNCSCGAEDCTPFPFLEWMRCCEMNSVSSLQKATKELSTHHSSQMRTSAPLSCLFLSCFRRNVAPLKETINLTSLELMRAEVVYAPSNYTISLHPLTFIRMIPNVNPRMFLGSIRTNAHFSTSWEAALALTSDTDDFR